MEGYSGHTYHATTNQDPYWDFYREFLYPGPVEYQSILNRRVIEKLEQHGDDLSQAREIEHFLFLKFFGNKFKKEFKFRRANYGQCRKSSSAAGMRW